MLSNKHNDNPQQQQAITTATIKLNKQICYVVGRAKPRHICMHSKEEQGRTGQGSQQFTMAGELDN